MRDARCAPSEKGAARGGGVARRPARTWSPSLRSSPPLSSLRMRAADMEGAFEGAAGGRGTASFVRGGTGEPRVPQPAWLSRPKRGRRRGRAWDGCCGGSAQGPDGSSAGVKTRELWRGADGVDRSRVADRRARLDALRARCRKRASSVAKPRPHCNSSRRRSATAAVPGAKRSVEGPPVSHPRFPLRGASARSGRRRGEAAANGAPFAGGSRQMAKGTAERRRGVCGRAELSEGGGRALCRLSLVQGKRRFLATKPRSGTLRRSFGVLWPAPILPTWAFVVREHSFPLRWGGFRAKTRFGGQKSRAREHERASRCVRGWGWGGAGRAVFLAYGPCGRRACRRGTKRGSLPNSKVERARSKRAKQTSDKRRGRGTGLTRGMAARAPSGALAQIRAGRTAWRPRRESQGSPFARPARRRGFEARLPRDAKVRGPRAADASASRKPRPRPASSGPLVECFPDARSRSTEAPSWPNRP